MLVKTYLIIISVYCLVQQANSARILAVFPVPSISHQVVFRPLTQELARRGHELTILTPDPAFPKGDAPANITEIDVHDISYNAWREIFVNTVDGKTDSFTQMEQAFIGLTGIIEQQWNTTEVQALLNLESDYFDLILTEACVRLALAFAVHFDAPVIQVSSFGALDDNFAVIGAPQHPFLYPDFLNKRLGNLTIWEKISELYFKFRMKHLIWKLQGIEDIAVKKYFGDNSPKVNELEDKVEMLFLNVNPIWQGNRPVPPGVIYMGGLHVKPKKELPKEIKNYLDSSAKGVIYISFGTNVDPSLLPPERIQTLANVFSRLPYDVLWKWNADVLPGKPNNVRISKWLPQSDLLRHPNLKLFITQGGLQSTDEAISAGVPMVGIPMLGDQWYNVEKYVQYNIGKRLDLETITEEAFEKAITTVIEDKRYRENVVRLSKLMRDEPQKPLDRAVWWAEYVIRHGTARHLRSPSANVSWSEFLALDVVLVLASIAFAALTVLVIICYCLVLWFLNVISLRDKLKLH